MAFGSIALKLLLCFIIIVLYLKLSSNSQLAPMTASDQVGNIVIGALAGGTLTSDVSTWALCGAISLWGALQLGVRAVKYRSTRVSALIDGERVQLMKNGRLLTGHFDKTKLSPEDFLMNLHQMDINSINEVRNVWFEPSGELTIDKKSDPLLSHVLISNGAVVHDALQSIGKNKAWLEGALLDQGYTKPGDVFLAEWHDDRLWLYPYDETSARHRRQEAAPGNGK